MLAMGLMSGTSLDGVDVAVIETNGAGLIRFVGSFYLPYNAQMKERLLATAKADVPLNELLRVEQILTLQHVEAVFSCVNTLNIDINHVDVIGFHGQTIRHLPNEGLTWQIGDASLLAEKTGRPVVADFRRRDMAAGGQGAPLIPLYHQALLASQPKPVAILNIGGVANITWIGENNEVIAGDTGPGMGLIDRWANEFNALGYDKDGMLAEKGRIHHNFVTWQMENHTFFAKPLPKSADRYDFDTISMQNFSAEDGAATLCAITAGAVGKTLAMLPQTPKKLWLTGGGSQHPTLVRLLADLAPVAPVEELGLRHDSMEAECFAWLAVRRLKGLPATLATTTGAQKATVGGLLTY